MDSPRWTYTAAEKSVWFDLVYKADNLKAMELWETARPLFERSSQYKQIVHLDEKLAGLGS
jgi:hypothetical protein